MMAGCMTRTGHTHGTNPTTAKTMATQARQMAVSVVAPAPVTPPAMSPPSMQSQAAGVARRVGGCRRWMSFPALPDSTATSSRQPISRRLIRRISRTPPQRQRSTVHMRCFGRRPRLLPMATLRGASTSAMATASGTLRTMRFRFG